MLLVKGDSRGPFPALVTGLKRCHVAFRILAEFLQETIRFSNPKIGGKGCSNEFLQRIDNSCQCRSNGQTLFKRALGHNLSSNGSAVHNRNGNESRIHANQRGTAKDNDDRTDHTDTSHRKSTPLLNQLSDIDARTKVKNNHCRAPFGNYSQARFIDNVRRKHSGQEASQKD